MTVDINNISDSKPLVIRSQEEFLECVKAFLARSIGVGVNSGEATVQQEEVSIRVAKAMLAAKGYHVKSHVAFKECVKGLTPVKRGRHLWYKTADIAAIPKIA